MQAVKQAIIEIIQEAGTVSINKKLRLQLAKLLISEIPTATKCWWRRESWWWIHSSILCAHSDIYWVYRSVEWNAQGKIRDEHNFDDVFFIVWSFVIRTFFICIILLFWACQRESNFFLKFRRKCLHLKVISRFFKKFPDAQMILKSLLLHRLFTFGV